MSQVQYTVVVTANKNICIRSICLLFLHLSTDPVLVSKQQSSSTLCSSDHHSSARSQDYRNARSDEKKEERKITLDFDVESRVVKGASGWNLTQKVIITSTEKKPQVGLSSWIHQKRVCWPNYCEYLFYREIFSLSTLFMIIDNWL